MPVGFLLVLREDGRHRCLRRPCCSPRRQRTNRWRPGCLAERRLRAAPSATHGDVLDNGREAPPRSVLARASVGCRHESGARRALGSRTATPPASCPGRTSPVDLLQRRRTGRLAFRFLVVETAGGGGRWAIFGHRQKKGIGGMSGCSGGRRRPRLTLSRSKQLHWTGPRPGQKAGKAAVNARYEQEKKRKKKRNKKC